MNLSNLSVVEVLKGLESGELTSVALMKHFLKNIKKLNEDYNVYLFVRDEDTLLEEAKAADKERASGETTKRLLGVPFSVKDSYQMPGVPATAGDKYLKGTKSGFYSTIVKKLLNEGAILVGKVNMDAWGFGSSTENSSYKVTKNPYDKNRVAGGSSGGSAASVALDMCSFSIGEDTGGSIRNPAAFCGVYGLKPTYGRVSRFGCIAYASSLDSVGPITRSSEDLGVIFKILQGKDKYDMTVESVPEDFDAEPKMRFAYSMDFVPESINEDIRTNYLATIERFKDLGYEAVEHTISTLNYCIPTYYITAMSEASTNLARFHGTRYGAFSKKYESGKAADVKTWEDVFTLSRTEGFNAEAKRRIFLGSYVLSEGYFDAYYKKAQKVRNLISSEINGILNDVDFIVSPVAPSPALQIGEKTTNPVEMYLEDIYTVTANLTGIPSVAFPTGKSGKLPIGMQIMGKKFNDELLVEIVSQYQKQS